MKEEGAAINNRLIYTLVQWVLLRVSFISVMTQM